MSALDRAIDSYRGTLVEYGYSDTSAKEAAQELLDLRDRLAKAEELLRRLEWEGVWHTTQYTCPECQQRKDAGHSSTCELDTFLKGVK